MEIEHLMLRLGRMLSADNSLRVRVRGSEAFSSPGEIVLPSIEHLADLGLEDAERMLHGLVDHETGHAVDTDHAVFGAIREGSLLRLVTNAIEDAVIERRRGFAYPGSRYNLGAKNAYYWQRLREQLEEGGAPLLWRIVASLAGVTRVDGSPTLREIADADPELESPLALVLEAVGDLDALARSPGPPTRESEARARRAIARLGLDPDATVSPEQPCTPEAAVVTVLRERMNDDDGAPYTVFDYGFDLEVDLRGDPGRYAALVSETLPVVSQLAGVFETAFYAKTEVRVLPAADAEDARAEVDVQSLASYALGAVDVADIWESRTGAATAFGRPAVAVLIDCSGSMAGARAATARLCAVACHEALDRVHCPHEITGFTTALSDYYAHPWVSNSKITAHFQELRGVLVEAAKRGERLSRYARTCASDDPSGAVTLQVPTYGVFKAFDSPDASGIPWISGIANNLDGEALLWQARRLAQRPESRKVLIVLSDGLPNGSNRRAQGERYLAESIRRAVSSGIEVYAIGIQSHHVQHYYPHWRICDSISGLPDAMASVLHEAVLGGGA